MSNTFPQQLSQLAIENGTDAATLYASGFRFDTPTLHMRPHQREAIAYRLQTQGVRKALVAIEQIAPRVSATILEDWLDGKPAPPYLDELLNAYTILLEYDTAAASIAQGEQDDHFTYAENNLQLFSLACDQLKEHGLSGFLELKGYNTLEGYLEDNEFLIQQREVLREIGQAGSSEV